MKKFGTSNKDAVVSVLAGADKEVMDKNNMKDGFKFVMEAKVCSFSTFDNSLYRQRGSIYIIYI